jgi:hypothetical protein
MSTLLPSNADFNFHILLKQTDSSRVVASIAELADCQVEAETRKEALVAIQALVGDRLSDVEVLPLEVSLKGIEAENPWTEFIGLFEGDTEFAEIAAQLQAERALEANYGRRSGHT